jgi:adenosylcobinamide kinase / adenosylcobinamide-phosphate guanylyltransferase
MSPPTVSGVLMAPQPPSTIILVGGGVRCGKSAFALARASSLGGTRAFVATAQAFDDEMRDRITAHQQERAASFTTIEAPLDVAQAVLGLAETQVVVIDCLTLWLSNLLMAEKTDVEIYTELERLMQAIESRSWHVVLVTNEVGLGVVPASPLGRRFRDLAGRIHQRMVERADEIYFGALGAMLRLRPNPVSLVTRNDFRSPLDSAPSVTDKKR